MTDNTNQDDIRELRIILLDDVMRSLEKHRRRALAVLIFILVSAVIAHPLQAAPGDSQNVLNRIYLYVSVGGSVMCSTVFLGATVWLSRLRKEREQVMRAN